MRILLLILVALLTGAAASIPVPPLAAESEAFRQLVLRKQPLLETPMAPAEKLPAYVHYDFSPLWLEVNNDGVRGFAGAHYQRLWIRILAVHKSDTDPTLYLVTGKTRVLGIIRSFRGTVRLQHVREALNRRLPPLEEYPRIATVRKTGVMLARYDLFEDSTQTKTGVFRGVLATYWYTDRKQRLHYDDLEDYADGYTNNQYVGTWTSYSTGKTLRCNWGDFRIPNSSDFDIGAGEFSPADEYLAYGWQDVRDATFGPEEKAVPARRREARAWWK